jgi:di/tricarboxylate transporter
LLATGIFAGAILLASFGVLYLTVALGCVVALYVLFGIVPLREIYTSVEWSVIVLLGALIPIAIDIAYRLQVSPAPFLMAVAVAASCAFLTPVGHKNNTLIIGPSGHRFGDYWRMGLPLEILVVAVGVPTILFFWPL